MQRILGGVAFPTGRDELVIVSIIGERDDVIPIHLYNLWLPIQVSPGSKLITTIEAPVVLVIQDTPLAELIGNPSPFTNHVYLDLE